MDRLTVITRAALALRAGRPAGLASAPSTLPSMTLVEALCATCAGRPIVIKRAAAQDAILGGAWARLQLSSWSKPERGGFIWIQAGLEPEKQAFSIAHELGHLILHRGEGATPPCPDTAISEIADVAALRVAREGRVEEYNPRARRELEANAFAAELLAPGDETRRLFMDGSGCDEGRIAAVFGVSPRLARARLVASVLGGAPAAAETAEATPAVVVDERERRARAVAQLEGLDSSQREAATAPGPALVVAGPGTGKTATLVGRVAHLYGQRDAAPETILALTFSNRAADEMRERLITAGLPGERAPVMTIHAFAAELLRRFASSVPHAEDEEPLPPDFRILDNLDALLLLEELLPKLGLRRLRRLGDPTGPLPDLLTCFSWARDRLLAPAGYHALVAAMRPAPDAERAPAGQSSRGAKKTLQPGTFSADQIERAREQARAYAVWDRELRRRGLLDYGALIQRAVETLRAVPQALDEARNAFQHILVDEFQDTNAAAAELLFLLAGEKGEGLWVVGDRHQSIYRWRGASPDNLPELTRRYPALKVRTLRVCYRSVPDIVRLGSDMAARMAALAGEDSPPGAPALNGASGSAALAEALRPVRLEADRPALGVPAVWRGEGDGYATAADERAAVVADILRRHDAEGMAWRDMAALSYKRGPGKALAADLAARGVPVTARGEFFARDEIKDTLGLVRLAASHDAGGLLRARGLLALLGLRSLAVEDERALGRAVRRMAGAGAGFPWSLRDADALLAAGTPEGLVSRLQSLGATAADLWWAKGGMAQQLAAALLRPGGMAWRLARIASEQDAPTSGADDPLGEPGRSAARASDALAALGALVSLAARFDLRWATEPGFRQQLSGLAARDDDDDAPAPPNGAEQPAPAGEAASEEQAPERAARCFLRYLTTFLRTRDEVAMPPGDEDAVRVLTIHGAKGLEFPAVYLLCLSASGFKGQAPSVVDPTRPASDGGPDSREAGDEAERRSLLYVAATRARDALVITRANSYRDNGAADKPLPAATILEASEVYANAAMLPPAGGSVPASASEDGAGEDGEEDEDGDEGGVAAAPFAEIASSPPAVDAPARPVFSYYALDMYGECPRRYRYKEVYHLRDESGPVVAAFHRFVRRGLDEQRRLRAERPDATRDEARSALATLWDEQPGGRGVHHATYKDYALDILDAEWERVAQTDGVPERLDLRVPLRSCDVELTVDAVMADGAVILERPHTGRPNKEHESDPRLPLMLLGYRQRDPDAQVSVRLVYLGAPLGDVGDASADGRHEAARQRQVVDVTARARGYADDYLAGRGRYQKLFKLDKAARGIGESRFPPRPGDHCGACPYAHICPGDLPE